ncbi:chorismate synthase [Triangularia verruculosa]|uniref:chorismate synthase n=1 Tax=Triangularia verruculosa TaxID=2587418 RepID=A0AAN6X9Q1_9PEZI|nr:chorismate synthase [Triangularia verruculosa]
MDGNTFGKGFTVTTWGESHGKSVGCTVGNVPAQLRITEADVQPQLTRRRPGQSAITTPRDEKDRVEIQSGVQNGLSLGLPMMMVVKNEDQRPKDYGNKTMDMYPRPSHADFTTQAKYGIKSESGGGRSSARETIARVAAGAVAEKYMMDAFGIEIVAFTSSIGGIDLFPSTPEHPSPVTDPKFHEFLDNISRETVDKFLPVRCPDQAISDKMVQLITEFKDRDDSIGGTVTCVVRNVPVGLGEPAFDKLEAMLAHAMLSIPATKSFEIGSGLIACTTPGSIHNDPFVSTKGKEVPPSVAKSGAYLKGFTRPKLTTKTNFSGGIQGGITNGAPIYFKVGFKPPATIGQDQLTATYDGESEGVLAAKGRHDPCVVPRAIPIVEAMAAITVMDALVRHFGPKTLSQYLPYYREPNERGEAQVAVPEDQL